MKNIIIISLLLFIYKITAQTDPFQIHIEPFEINSLGGIQAYSFGQSDGKWLIIGGRLDGLHRRQPFASFDIAGNNNQLIVIDPKSLKKWSSTLLDLPTSIQEQMSSTNMEFYQEGDYLYIIGGYGYNVATDSKKTFDKLTIVDVKSVINSIINGEPFTKYFRQITDPMFAVTGGHLKKINNTYYLIGGNKFDGNYNPMGNPTYTQLYTNSIIKFKIIDDGVNLSINHLNTLTDITNLHRRDYNAVSQILPNGAEGITVFSGVFQPNIDLPYLNCVNIDSITYQVDNNFKQLYNHYHCASLPLYSALDKEMHNIFFGGIAQFYENNGMIVQDNNVPFVRTIARVSRTNDGKMTEYKLPIEMPSYIGASSEFIPINNIPHYDNHVIKLDELSEDSTLVGYIYGGISSTAPNIFFSNNGTQSFANNQIFRVFVIKNKKVNNQNIYKQSESHLKVQIVPNANNGDFIIKYYLNNITDTKIKIFNNYGQMLDEIILKNNQLGENSFHYKNFKNLLKGTLILIIETPTEIATQKVIID